MYYLTVSVGQKFHWSSASGPLGGCNEGVSWPVFIHLMAQAGKVCFQAHVVCWQNSVPHRLLAGGCPQFLAIWTTSKYIRQGDHREDLLARQKHQLLVT